MRIIWGVSTWAMLLSAVAWSDCSQALVQDLYKRLNSSAQIYVLPESSLAFKSRLAVWDESVHAPQFFGGEGEIFLSPRHPGRALKHWFPSRTSGFKDSTNLLIALQEELTLNPELARYVAVVKIHERGPDWILRDFSPASVPAKRAIQDFVEVRRAWESALASARRARKNPVMERIRDLIKNRKGVPSDNLHWDPVRRKFLIIDGI